MHQFLRRLGLGLTLLAALALLTLVTGSQVRATPVIPESLLQGDSNYVGSRVCRLCHRDIAESMDQTLHPKMLLPRDQATVLGQFPVTDVNGQTWTLDDVDYVMGAGKWKQRYVKVIDGVWRILPVQWNTVTQEWVPYHPDNWMERDYKQLCAGCHVTGFDLDTGSFVDYGVTCEACHGPGRDHVLNPFENKPFKEPDARTCGQCHVRGKDKATNTHGWPEGYVPGSGEEIDAYYNYDWSTKRWWYDNPDDPDDPGHAKSHHQQYMEWMNSKHSQSLDNLRASGHAQDFCLQCHSEDYRQNKVDLDPNNDRTVDTARYPITCQTCHYSHVTSTSEVLFGGAASDPSHQLRADEYTLCTSCHNGTSGGTRPIELGDVVHHPMQEMYEGTSFPGVADNPSPHYAAMVEGRGGPVCASCHFVETAKSALPGDIPSHLGSVVMPGDAKEGEPDSCTSCHTNADRDALQALIDGRQAEIRQRLAELQAWLDANPDQAETEAYKTAFTAVSFVQSEGSFGIHNYYYAKDILRAAFQAIGQVMPEAKSGYVGAKTCATCHADTYTVFSDTLHPWKLRPKEEATIVGQFPVTDVNGVTWTLDDVDWVIGARPKWKQRYIKIIDGIWRILPVQWNLKTQEWVPYHADDWADGTPERDYKQLCAGCHTTGFNVMAGMWADPGVTCEACHGPGEQHARSADPSKIVASADAEICGACHSRGKDKATNTHGWPEGYMPGGDVSLGDVYNFDESAKRWWFDNPDDPTDPGHAKSHHQQYMEWARSGHAQALENLRASGHARDFCLQCHSADYRLAPEGQKPTVETAQFGLTCVACHAVHDNGAEGTHQLLAPEYQLCTECHNGTLGGTRPLQPGDTAHHPMQEMFEGWGALNTSDLPSAHYLTWQSGNGGPICSDCHYVRTAKSAVWDPVTGEGDITSHLGTLVEPGFAKAGEPDSCTKCHGWGAAFLQEVVEGRQRDIRNRLATLAALLDRWSGLSESELWKVAYTNETFVNSEGSFGIHNYGYANAVLDTAEEAFSSFTSVYVPMVIK